MPDATCTLNGPATELAVAALRARFPHLPGDYFSFLLRANGGEGMLGISPGHFVHWPAEDVARFTLEYQVHIHLPGYAAIGSSGGGDLLVFPASGMPPGIFAVPAIGMATEVVELVASGFPAFVAEFGKAWKAHA
jgi:hypothetical protein